MYVEIIYSAGTRFCSLTVDMHPRRGKSGSGGRVTAEQRGDALGPGCLQRVNKGIMSWCGNFITQFNAIFTLFY